MKNIILAIVALCFGFTSFAIASTEVKPADKTEQTKVHTDAKDDKAAKEMTEEVEGHDKDKTQPK